MSTQAPSGVDEVHILSTSKGMSCDGESVSITAAMLPSIQELVLGAIPGLPTVLLHNKVLSPTRAATEPLTLPWWMDQLAHKVWGVVAIGTCASYGGRLDEALRSHS